MSVDWTHQFCLACDKQTDGATYCSESCRIADYEKTSAVLSSGASSPTSGSPSCEWSWTKHPSNPSPRFYLSPAYDFSNPKVVGPRLATHSIESSVPHTSRALSPSNSQTSLSSMRSTISANAEAAQLSEKAAKELRGYAQALENVRLQRRRSY